MSRTAKSRLDAFHATVGRGVLLATFGTSYAIDVDRAFARDAKDECVHISFEVPTGLIVINKTRSMAARAIAEKFEIWEIIFGHQTASHPR
jgi:hypothetical protein